MKAYQVRIDMDGFKPPNEEERVIHPYFGMEQIAELNFTLDNKRIYRLDIFYQYESYLDSYGTQKNQILVIVYKTDGFLEEKIGEFLYNINERQPVAEKIYTENKEFTNDFHAVKDFSDDDIDFFNKLLDGITLPTPELRSDIKSLNIHTGNYIYYGYIYIMYTHETCIIEWAKTKYEVRDLYCSNPTCNCNNVYLTFIELDSCEKPQVIMEDAFTIDYKFETQEYSIVSNQADLPLAQIDSTYKALIDFIGNKHKALQLFQTRYKRIKKWARENPDDFANSVDYPEEELLSNNDYGFDDDSYIEKPYVREKQKIGRNSLCPCGSGKKYKKCCGRSLSLMNS